MNFGHTHTGDRLSRCRKNYYDPLLIIDSMWLRGRQPECDLIDTRFDEKLDSPWNHVFMFRLHPGRRA
jgi:hypothetical protein